MRDSESKIYQRDVLATTKKRRLGKGKHCEDIAPEGRFDVVQLRHTLSDHSTSIAPRQSTDVNLDDTLRHDLLARIVDKDIQCSVFLKVLVHNGLAIFGFHEVERESQAILAVLFDSLLDILSATRESRSAKESEWGNKMEGATKR